MPLVGNQKCWKKTNKQSKKSRLTRRNKMMGNLIGSLESFQALMEFKGKYFDGYRKPQ